MKQLMMRTPGDLKWVEIPEPDLQGPKEALVSPLAVATCDIDGPMVKGQAPVPAPIALGHECVAEVIDVGPDVNQVAVGDRVVVPFQINCGECAACHAGLTGSCLSVAENSMFGFGALGGDWGGMFADVLRVPYADAMLMAIPGDVDAAALASASDNIPDGWRTVAPYLADQPGADVLVLGGGAPSVGLYAAGIAMALGAGKVTYVDRDPHRLTVASDWGAEVIDGELPNKFEPRAIVVDAGASRESLACACRSTGPGGTCTHVGIIPEPETPVPLLEMYLTGVTLHAGRAMVRAALPNVLELIANGRFDPHPVVEKVLPFAAAATELLQPHTKLAFSRDA
jgi:threonine dehydrogenase-like Zn-dependent dehydrogenase